MSATISTASGTITPTLVTSYESGRASGSVLHELVGGGEAVSMRTATMRTGTLELLFADEASAAAAETAHIAPGRFTLTYPERPSVEMTYVVAPGGNVGRMLEQDTRDTWRVTVDFKEVDP